LGPTGQPGACPGAGFRSRPRCRYLPLVRQPGALPSAVGSAIPKRPVDPNALTLLGVLTSDGPGTGAIALMRRNQTGQNVRLQEGDTVDGWTIERIERARVHLRQGDTKIALELFRRR